MPILEMNNSLSYSRKFRRSKWG